MRQSCRLRRRMAFQTPRKSFFPQAAERQPPAARIGSKSRRSRGTHDVLKQLCGTPGAPRRQDFGAGVRPEESCPPALSPNLRRGRPLALPVQPTPSVVRARPCRLDEGRLHRLESTWISRAKIGGEGWIRRALRAQRVCADYTQPQVSSPRKRGPNHRFAQGASWVPAFRGNDTGGWTKKKGRPSTP
jgi:hypothetical protein